MVSTVRKEKVEGDAGRKEVLIWCFSIAVEIRSRFKESYKKHGFWFWRPVPFLFLNTIAVL